MSHGFPIDLSARYVNRVLVEVDENGGLKVDGVQVEGEKVGMYLWGLSPQLALIPESENRC